MSDPNQSTHPERWVDQYGDDLFRFAMFRLRDPHLAEDVVQEALLAALRNREKFSGKSSERVWLIGILKNKIVDHIRQVSRERPLSDLESSTESSEELFDPKGKWREIPPEWDTDPSTLLEQREFREVLEGCMAGLPDRLSDAFALREMDGLSSGTVCAAMKISAANLWVMLHRARMRLRRCLEINWFGLKQEGAL
jgi:RNA polymerase sigma-70 factor (TIGR02943 family)